MRKNILPVILTVSVLVCGCAGMGQKTGSGNEPDSSASLETAENGGKFSDAQASGETGGMEISDSFGNGINEFGWMLYDKMQGSDNLFYSPYSIESALMMAASGAAGKTQEQMYSVLGVSDTDSFMNDYNNFRNLKQSEKAELTTANSIWADSSSIGSTGQINADYGSRLKKYMGTEIFPVDFSGNSEEVNKKITDWVNKNTEGLLPDYHSQAGPDTVMDLVNAVYFYGEWQDSFRAEDTYEQIFLGKTSEKEVEMMHKNNADFKYYDDNHFKGMEMPYADSSIVMDLIISSDGEAVNVGEEWAELADSLRVRYSIERVLLTRGARGMALFCPDVPPRYIRAVMREVADVSGAGDTVIATLGACIGIGLTWEESMDAANAAAGVVVGKMGTAPVSITELRQALRQGADNPKLYGLPDLLEKVEDWRRKNESIVFTNGCFDLLHPGHISLIRQSAAQGTHLVVGLNSDASVRRLKGPSRPVQNEQSRALLLSALHGVDAVVIFDEDTPLNLVAALRPDVLVKGSDYTVETVVGADVVLAAGGRVYLADLVQGCSTTGIVRKIDASGGNRPLS